LLSWISPVDVERHLGRELERALHRLPQLQAVRLEQDEGVDGVLGGVLHTSRQLEK
jgi:hypothetical protein